MTASSEEIELPLKLRNDLENLKIFMLPQFTRQFEKQSKEHLPWIEKIQEEAFERFQKLGYPTPHQEEWRYTNVKKIAETPFKTAVREKLPQSALEIFEHYALTEINAYRLTFVNGHYVPALSSLEGIPPRVQIENLSKVLTQNPKWIEPFLSRLAEDQNHPFLALNTALFRDGAFIRVPQKTLVEKPIELLFIASSENGNGKATANHPRNLIVVEEESQVALIEHYVGLEKGIYLTNAVTEIFTGPGAIVNHHKLQTESADAFHMATLGVHQAHQSTFASTVISIGAALSRNDITTILKEEGSESILNGLYLVGGNQHVDHHTTIDHRQPHCTSNELYKGILGGKAQGVFNGKIIVRANAQKTQARQTNKNLLLSEDAVINTKPLLEILNNDVKCNHGATIGRLDENQIFYLRSRGIHLDLARFLLTHAFAREVTDSIRIDSLRKALENRLSVRWMNCPIPGEGI